MDSPIRHYIKKLLYIGGIGATIALLLMVALPYSSWAAVFLGYMLSFIFVASNFFVVRKIDLKDQEKFLKLFFGSLAARFIIVLSVFVLILLVIKIDQIFFTVSFIISYIFHSVIEIIFINKILEIENENR